MPHQLDFLCARTFEEEGRVIDRRLNVAMTRAREQMVLVGNPSLLSLNPVLSDITQL
jgi:superfamily I DNA and/or RNA helicase